MVPPSIDLLHRPLAALVRAYGAPTAVATKDDGQHVDFGDDGAQLDAIVDDDGTIHALDVALPAGTSYAFTLDGATRRVTFGVTTSTAARDAFAASAETDGANFRVFRSGPTSAVVLRFDPATSLLAHVIAGDRETLLRLGYVRDAGPVQPPLVFTAPKLRRTAIAAGSGARATVLRVDLDRGGAVRGVSVLVPSGDDAFDAQLAKLAASDRYDAATLGGRTIGASMLREVRH